MRRHPLELVLSPNFTRAFGAAYILVMGHWALALFERGQTVMAAIVALYGIGVGAFAIHRDWSQPFNAPTWRTASWAQRTAVVGFGASMAAS